MAASAALKLRAAADVATQVVIKLTMPAPELVPLQKAVRHCQYSVANIRLALVTPRLQLIPLVDFLLISSHCFWSVHWTFGLLYRLRAMEGKKGRRGMPILESIPALFLRSQLFKLFIIKFRQSYILELFP